jgi:translation elongation factor EF-Tu-like GTPase
MGLWARLTGREGDDTTVEDALNRVTATPVAVTPAGQLGTQDAAAGSAASASGQFRMTIEDVFTITGRGTVVTGEVQSGAISVGDPIEVSGPPLPAPIPVTVAGIEAMRQRLKHAEAGAMIGLLFKEKDVGPHQLRRGMVLTRR